ncbi:MAG: type II secretion system protein [Olsenella sp.]|nr:type II secretion system protein [Olsenella sp.]
MNVLKRRVSRVRVSRLRSQTGFTLTEMLAAILVLTLLTGVVSTGVAGAVDIYRRERFASQSQVLAGTIYNSLSTPFRFMKDGTETGTYMVKYNGEHAAQPDSLLYEENGRLYVVDDKHPLLMEKAYGNCDVEEFHRDISSDSVDISFAICDKTDKSLKKEYEFHFKPLGSNYKQEEGTT